MRKLISERELDKMLEKIEFKGSYPELVIKLISEVHNKSSLLYEGIKTINKMVKSKIDEIMAHHILSFKFEDVEFNDPIAGVDGSLVLVKGIGKNFFALISISQVIFTKGTHDIDDPKINLSVNIENIEEKYELSPKTLAVIKMMIGESRALNVLATRLQRGLIFLDGPIIDPPNLADPDYVKYRAEAISNALRSNMEIIGFVKRYKSNLIRDRIFRENEAIASDQEIIPILFSILRNMNYSNGEDILATRPYQITPDSEYVYSRNVLDLYDEYMHEKSLSKRIYASYIQIRNGIKPIKIEFFARDEEDATNRLSRLIKVIKKMTVAGVNLPLPVLLAHKTSLIRKKVAEVLFREVISRITSYYVSDFDAQSLRDMIYVVEE